MDDKANFFAQDDYLLVEVDAQNVEGHAEEDRDNRLVDEEGALDEEGEEEDDDEDSKDCQGRVQELIVDLCPVLVEVHMYAVAVEEP